MSFGVLIAVLIIILTLVGLLVLSYNKLNSVTQDLKKSRQKLEETESAHSRAISAVDQRLSEMHKKYAGIISHEEEIERLRYEAVKFDNLIEVTRNTYTEKRQLLDQLEAQIAIYDERLGFAQLGVYEPHFDYSDCESFRARIQQVREQQKMMISAKKAASCPKEWTVEGSKSKGQTMINRQIRLTLRAFNNECEAAIANVRWNNVVTMEKRILAAEQAINKENSSMEIRLNDEYVALKIEELRLTHEYRERLKAEKEERSELARAEREEKKLLAEAEAAEREELKYQALLDKARKEVGPGELSDNLKNRIAELELALKEAHDVSERARAMAEMTKSGYVYIISNIGSFGADVFKIGLTRRINPDDRVRELGDASVPFTFDTHAMIYSDEAPALEAALHREFEDRRINASNMRKEFFRVTLDEVEDAVSRLAPSATFFKDREAQEWYETLSRRNQILSDIHKASDNLPEAI